MYFVIYLSLGLLMIYPIYLFALRRNRNLSKHWWVAKEYIAIGAFFKSIIWPLYVILYLLLLLKVRAQRSLESDIGSLNQLNPKMVALGKIEETLRSLDYEKSLMETKGWSPWNLIKINNLCGKAYSKHYQNLALAGWTEPEIFDLFDKYIPDTMTSRLLKIKG